MNPIPLKSQLENQLRAIERLRERLSEVRHGLDLIDKSTTVYYAVDFSEIFSYLHYDEAEERNILGVTLALEDRDTNFLQYRLGLTHLFNSFVDRLYVLPSHTVEMWGFARTQASKRELGEEQANRFLERVRSLNPTLKKVLEVAARRDLSEEASQELLAFVKSAEFGPLCVEVSQFVNSFKRGNILTGLLREGRLSTRIDHLLSKHKIGLAELKEPPEKQILEVFKKFPRGTRHRKPVSTRIDARAFLVLQNLNRLLQRDNAHIVLITRDVHLFEIAESADFTSRMGWPAARQTLRGIESVFLDLTLSSSSTLEAKNQWIRETDNKLASMQKSLGGTLDRLDSDGSHSQSAELAAVGRKVIKETGELWGQHINVRLSLAPKFIPWLEGTLVELQARNDLSQTLEASRSEYQAVTNLLEYFANPIYRTTAGKDVKDIWKGIEIDCLRMGFLDLVGQRGTEQVRQVFSQILVTPSGDLRTILHSKRYHKMPSLQLVSNVYLDKLRALGLASDEEYERLLFSIIKEAVSGFKEPEDFLVMAFLLGLMNEWEQALVMIEKCRQVMTDLAEASIDSRIIPSEVDYFSSAIKRRLAQTTVDPLSSTKLFIDAYKDIIRAKEAVPDEVKYLVAEAATANLYHELVRNLAIDSVIVNAGIRVGLKHDILSESDAKKQYQRVLTSAQRRGDIRMTVVILNNLAFVEVFSEHPSFEEAESNLRNIDQIVENATGEQATLLSGVVLHINETRIMLRARRAKEDKNVDVLKECIQTLCSMSEDLELLEYERKGFASHIGEINKWLHELEPYSVEAN